MRCCIQNIREIAFSSMVLALDKLRTINLTLEMQFPTFLLTRKLFRHLVNTWLLSSFYTQYRRIVDLFAEASFKYTSECGMKPFD